ncbi:MAG: diaminopimelate decarboxylase [Actinomycetota bacterium]
MAERTTPLGTAEPTAGASPRPNPWPVNASFEADGMWIAGQSAVLLAERFATPLLVFDRADVTARLRAARLAFPKAFYAVKAFTAHAMLRLAVDEGLDLLAASGGEVEACVRAGAPPARIAFHGRNKSDDELALAVRARVGLVIADGSDELRRLDAFAGAEGVVQSFLLRVNPGLRVDTHESIATGHESTAFGVPAPAVSETVAAAASLSHLRFQGLHAHIGSQVLTMDPFLRELDVLVALTARLREQHGIAVDVLDMGGGFGITYTDEATPSVSEIGAAAERRLRVPCGERGLPVPLLAAEPGRSIVGNAAVTLYRVGDRRTLGDGRTVIAVDGGMSDNIRPMLYDAQYTVALASRPGGPSAEPVTIVGRHCESGDVLADDVTLPSDVERGDLLAFAATGAYTYSLASTYNRVGRPAVVAIREGRASVWIRREGAGDLDRLEAPAPRAVPAEDPPPGFTLRPAQPEDARSFLSFWKAIVAEGGYVRSEEVETPARVYRARFRHSWTDREAQVVALDGGRVVGHIYVQREAHPVTRHVATLGIAVAADRRGLGIGRALMAEAFRWARSVDVEKIMLSVYPYNHAAIALYRRFGFVEEGRLVGHSRKSTGYEDEILMSSWVEEGRGPW